MDGFSNIAINNILEISPRLKFDKSFFLRRDKIIQEFLGSVIVIEHPVYIPIKIHLPLKKH